MWRADGEVFIQPTSAVRARFDADVAGGYFLLFNIGGERSTVIIVETLDIMTGAT